MYRFCGGATDIDTALWMIDERRAGQDARRFGLGQLQNFSHAVSALTFRFVSDASNTFAGFQLVYDFCTQIVVAMSCQPPMSFFVKVLFGSFRVECPVLCAFALFTNIWCLTFLSV